MAAFMAVPSLWRRREGGQTERGPEELYPIGEGSVAGRGSATELDNRQCLIGTMESFIASNMPLTHEPLPTLPSSIYHRIHQAMVVSWSSPLLVYVTNALGLITSITS